jgi:hypothetical protein
MRKLGSLMQGNAQMYKSLLRGGCYLLVSDTFSYLIHMPIFTSCTEIFLYHAYFTVFLSVNFSSLKAISNEKKRWVEKAV